MRCLCLSFPVPLLVCACNASQCQALAEGVLYADSVLGAGAVTQCDEPSQAQIDETHARFVDALQATFEQHKHLLGPAWARKTLQIV